MPATSRSRARSRSDEALVAKTFRSRGHVNGEERTAGRRDVRTTSPRRFAAM